VAERAIERRPGGQEAERVRLMPRPSVGDDAGLVRRARVGDEDAFAALYLRYAPVVHGILLARVPRPEVRDLVQDVFLLALQRLGALRDPAAFGGWLVRIARHRAADFHRARRDIVPLPDGDFPGEAVEPETDDGEAARVLAIVRSLPEAYRETLVMRLVEGLTGPEIAARTGLTPASVRVNLHRGMKLLRTRLGLGAIDA
jgi:RNA polymerase sigma-70 factor (ECF subfamily)